jgi:hypothetical protein
MQQRARSPHACQRRRRRRRRRRNHSLRPFSSGAAAARAAPRRPKPNQHLSLFLPPPPTPLSTPTASTPLAAATPKPFIPQQHQQLQRTTTRPLSSSSTAAIARFSREGAATGQRQQQQQQAPALRPGETREQAAERRARESSRVEERVADVEDAQAWHKALQDAGDRLVVLEVEAEGVCQTGLEEEADTNWELDRRAALQPCLGIKSTLQRTARECPDVVFLSLSADTDEGAALCGDLGVTVLPTIQFWRRGVLLWEHRGVRALEQDLGEGVLYFGGAAGAGGRLDAQGMVAELRSREDLEAFVSASSAGGGGGEQAAAAAAADGASPAASPPPCPPDRVLSVVNVATSGASPCIHVYPAVVALARSFQGYARFARLLVDAEDKNHSTTGLLGELNVLEVPTFIFFRGGKEVGRHVGSSRGDLMGRIMETQMEAGVRPPPPPPGAAAAKRRVMERRVIKRRV